MNAMIIGGKENPQILSACKGVMDRRALYGSVWKTQQLPSGCFHQPLPGYPASQELEPQPAIFANARP